MGIYASHDPRSIDRWIVFVAVVVVVVVVVVDRVGRYVMVCGGDMG